MICGVGLELVEIAPFQQLLSEPGVSALELHFTEGELGYCRGKRNGGEPLAARHAAKIATLKALSLETWSDVHLRAVEVVRAASGKPDLVLSEPASSLARERGIGRLHVSLSHSGGFAVAMVVAELENPTGEVR